MILVTGGLGFIGSHTVVELVNKNKNVVIVDDESNANKSILDKIKHLCDENKIIYYNINILDNDFIDVFKKHRFESVIHFAAFKSVNESVSNPLKYYYNNVSGTIKLLKLCDEFNVKRFIFSSSATVYGSSKSPLCENSITGIGITNPYGQSKYMVENILLDYSPISKMKIVVLRYFNPVGAHPSGQLGENPKGIPNNLMPYIIRVAVQNNLDIHLDDVYDKLNIFGNDYETNDGTCERDFIHVVDLAIAHISALRTSFEDTVNIKIFNVGTGKSTSVNELINTFEKVNNVIIPRQIQKRRIGDLDVVFCNCEKIHDELKWCSNKNIEDICRDGWNFALKFYKNQ